MRRNPERLAWGILLLSFFTCISLTVGVPLGVRHYILYARVGQNVTLEVQRGPLRVTLAGRGEPVAIAEERDDIPERTIVATDSTAGRLVMHANGSVIATVQIYDDTEIVLSSARSPRFSASRLPHRITLEVRAGRVRIGVSDSEDRPTVVEVNTPYGTVTLAEGSYEIRVNGTAVEVTVRDGQADVVNDAEQVKSLGPAERVTMDSEQIIGPLPAARNLIINGDFQAPLENGWSSYSEQTAPEQPPARVSIITDEGRKVVNFYRDGSNHAEVGIRQEINYDVRDFTALELHLAVRIIHQNILGFGGCGYLSSECPIIVRVDYKDVWGTDRYWLHGFYTGEPASDWPLEPWTEQIPLGNWQTYDSGNLMEELAEAPPASIKQLTIYASGHSFNAMVTEVELLAQE
ncbi:MAG: hypothetical protein DRI79_14275 [Chloroflexi bacterium]|nr:MAG: hypothetical protein DRI80_00555 [Chloroflexota bacterium]RLC83093.1 MAG: hypothetical protein DRI79_14275 [Chloroflexota bacterium]HEY68242.1 hypothetical protein [Thermoflexia bacterium]